MKGGNIFLMGAARNGNVVDVQARIDTGADVNYRDNGGWTALMYAAAAGHLATVNLLIDLGANVYHSTNNGNTALMYAAENGHMDVINQLLVMGADIDATDVEDATALIYAVIGDSDDVVQLLIAKGANIDHAPAPVDADAGGTALMEAVSTGNMDIIRALIDAGANTEVEDANGRTALVLVAQNVQLYPLQVADIVGLLLTAGADIDHQAHDDIQYTALIWAARNGYLSVVNLLLAAGADIEIENSSGDTALYFAAVRGHWTIVEKLLEMGANINHGGERIGILIDNYLAKDLNATAAAIAALADSIADGSAWAADDVASGGYDVDDTAMAVEFAAATAADAAAAAAAATAAAAAAGIQNNIKAFMILLNDD